jgi:hypothetical protein
MAGKYVGFDKVASGQVQRAGALLGGAGRKARRGSAAPPPTSSYGAGGNYGAVANSEAGLHSGSGTYAPAAWRGSTSGSTS